MRTRTRIARLFAGHDAGTWTLPDELLASRRAVDTLTAASRYGLTEPAARDAMYAATVAAARSGDPLPDPTSVLDARRADEGAQIILDVATAAGDREAERLVALAVDLGDAIITDHLRPALDAALTDGRKAYATYSDVGTDPHELLTAPARVREAFLAIEDPARRYAAVRAARGDLLTAGYQAERDQTDRTGYFGLFRNADAVWPMDYTGRGALVAPPWPTDPRDHFVWILAGAAEPWLPTCDEQDAAWTAYAAARRAKAPGQHRPLVRAASA